MTRRMLMIIVLIAAVALVAAIAHKASAPLSWPENEDAAAIKFSHTYHVKDAGIACADCHTAARASKNASDNLRPGHDNCTSCHEEQITNSCGYCHVDADTIQAIPAPVRTINFSHEQHIAGQGMECTSCHAGLEDVAYASPKNMPTMAACYTCHNDVKATNLCESCHTSFINLIPSDHLVADFKKDHKKLTRLGAMDVSCATCHDQSFCAQCHSGASLLQLGQSDLMTEPAPRTSPSDGVRQMTLQMAHSMNYRFTHGNDARGRASDCYSCHSPQTFCAECHATGGPFTGEGVKPSWHLGAGFTTFGRGSGGGRHAELARRDLEGCVSCHDVQGADPVCITCHADADGIKGTDPRTHGEAGFMRDDQGSWHTSQGATCYNCHTDFNAHPGGRKGEGFCGYCHGK